MKSKASKLAIAVVIVATVLALTVFNGFTRTTWALEEAIEALKDYKAVQVIGAFPGGTAEIWMRANAVRTQSTDVVVRGSTGTITWTEDGSTYHYEPGQNTVYYERVLTVGMAQWLGPELLEMLSTAENAEVIRGKDPATGRDRVLLLCSMIDVHGAQSWMITFDVANKLPVAMRQWQNLDRSGPPTFDAFKITYFQDLPESIFEVRAPGSPTFVQKPLIIPDENVGLLSDPKAGLPTEGLTQQEAADRILRALYQAVIDADMDTLKQLAPGCRSWGDEFIRSIIFKPEADDRLAKVLDIGRITEHGNSRLGPIAALPITMELLDGRKVQEKVIVQFRQLGGQTSCVVHGPYGLPREID